MKQLTFPFTALLGQESMQAALLANAVDPGIGGVLIRGQKGTGKSTAARALAALLPAIEIVADCPYHCSPDQPEQMHDGCRQKFDTGEPLSRASISTPFVDLPISAAEDRLVGTLHLGKTLQSGERHFEPGLLAAANRGILYVDEVNLLPDHLVDLLLDAAASGINLVEREGMQVVHPARFQLIGTMNPEEGELRPQFLDRFGLCVEVSGLTDASLRRDIIRRRLAFDQDQEAFRTAWSAQEELLAQQILAARSRLDRIIIPDEILDRAVALATAAGVQGHRADLALIRTARALTALMERPAVGIADLGEAARFVLPHRLENHNWGPKQTAAAQIGELLETHLELKSLSEQTKPTSPEDLEDLDDGLEFPGSAAAGVGLLVQLKKKLRNASSPRKNGST